MNCLVDVLIALPRRSLFGRGSRARGEIIINETKPEIFVL